MKNIIFVIFASISLPALSHAEQEGGGGHICKSLAMLYFDNLNHIFHDNESLTMAYPAWQKLKTVMNPKLNPGFQIKISKAPIQNCPGTENALACANPRANTLSIFCGENGWNSLTINEQYKHLIHELYWWHSNDDANYFYSTKLAADASQAINVQRALTKPVILRLGKGEVSSTEMVVNNITCGRLVDSEWLRVDNKYRCNQFNRCSIVPRINYSIVLNKQYILNTNSIATPINLNNGFYQSVPKGQFYEDVEPSCAAFKPNDEDLKILNSDIHSWLQTFYNINAGKVYVDSENPKRCRVNTFSGIYDKHTNVIEDYSYEENLVKCP